MIHIYIIYMYYIYIGFQLSLGKTMSLPQRQSLTLTLEALGINNISPLKHTVLEEILFELRC